MLTRGRLRVLLDTCECVVFGRRCRRPAIGETGLCEFCETPHPDIYDCACPCVSCFVDESLLVSTPESNDDDSDDEDFSTTPGPAPPPRKKAKKGPALPDEDEDEETSCCPGAAEQQS